MSYADITVKSNSKFLKIESGVPHDIRILDESPEEKIIHGFGPTSKVCDGEGCNECAIGDEPKQRFISNVYDFTVKRQMTWEYGGTVARQLKAIDNTLSEEGKKITAVDLKVEASGEKLSKKYMITPRMTSKPLPDSILPF